jgi:hypothetical protein
MAMDPNFVAERLEREPLRLPIGVRATPTMQTSRGAIEVMSRASEPIALYRLLLPPPPPPPLLLLLLLLLLLIVVVA